jgi:hypothetical protein
MMQKHTLQTKKKMKRDFILFYLSANKATKGKYRQAQNQEKQILA